MQCLQLGSGLNLDVLSVTSAQCLNKPEINFFNELTLHCVAPVGVAILIFAAYKNKLRKLRKDIR